MDDSATLQTELDARIRRFLDLRDTNAIVGKEALALAGRALLMATTDPQWVHAQAHLISVVAWFRLFRWEAYTLAGDDANAAYEHEICVHLFTFIYASRPDLVPEDMREPAKALAPVVAGDRAACDFEMAGILLRDGRILDDAGFFSAAIDLYRRGFVERPDAGDDRLSNLHNFAQALWEHYLRSADLAYLDAAIGAEQEAAFLAAAGYPERVSVLHNLGVLLQERFERTRSRSDLDSAVTATTEALAITPPDDPARPHRLSSLSIRLRTRFEYTADSDDIDQAIQLGREALVTGDAGGSHHGSYLSMLSLALHERFRHLGAASDTDEAISLGRQAVEAASPADPDRGRWLANLNMALMGRYYRFGSLNDLDEAIEVARTSANVPADDHVRGNRLAASAIALMLRARHTGLLADSNEAVSLLREAVKITPPGFADRAGYLHNLSHALHLRYERTGNPDDLSNSITAAEQATAATQTDHPEYPTRLSHLSYALYARFMHSQNVDDILRAVAVARQAVLSSAGPRHERAGILSDQGTVLRALAVHTGSIADMDAAVRACQEALAETPAGHTSWAGKLLNLGSCFATRFRLTRDPEDIDTAVRFLREALAAAGDDYPSRATIMSDLGMRLAERAEAIDQTNGDSSVFSEAYTWWRQAAHTESAPASVRLIAAGRWAMTAAKHTDEAQAVEAFAATVAVLPLAAWPGLPRQAQEQPIAVWGHFARDAAAWAIKSGQPRRAVELLEQGRTVIWSHLLQLRGDLGRLQAEHPAYAERLTAIRAAVDTSYEGEAELQHEVAGIDRERRMRLADEWDRVLQSVRALPGFSSFLGPLTFADLAAGIGDRTVVVINVSTVRCDALVLTRGEVRTVELRSLSTEIIGHHTVNYLRVLQEVEAANLGAHDAAQRYHSGDTSAEAIRQWSMANIRLATALQTREETLRTVTRWLWDDIAEPVLTFLGHHGSPDGELWPRIWWCPTGDLSLLPLHAAGYHGNGSERQRTVIDRVVSSYVPNIGALLAAPRALTDTSDDHMLVVALAETPGQIPLAGVQRERVLLAKLFDGHHTLLDGPAATWAAVRSHLPRHRWVHFSCHGDQSLDEPSHGGLLLYDRLLTIADISATTYSGDFAFLSACKTATGTLSLTDEAITLAAALHYAGYRGVIGTLWSVHEQAAADIAAAVYTDLISQGKFAPELAAVALHRAVRTLQRGPHTDRLSPLSTWTPFVHIGQ